MEAAVYFILFLCGTFSQGICNLSEENNEKASEILSRQRRISGGLKRPFEHAPQIIILLIHGRYHCPSTLLSTDVAITSAQCVKDQNQQLMTIKSRTLGGDRVHEVTRVIFLDPNYNFSHPTVNNLALVKFAPPINLSVSLNRPARLYSESLAIQDLRIEVFNWPQATYSGARRVSPGYFRSIFVRLISIDYCQSLYPGLIGRGTLCAYAENCGQRCHDEDSGAPLFAVGQLLGIMVFHGHNRHVNPDVFMNLMDTQIRRWIYEHIPSLRN